MTETQPPKQGIVDRESGHVKEYYRQRPWILRNGQSEQTSAADEAQLRVLKEQTRLSELTLRLCYSRGLKTAEEIARYLNPSFETLTPALNIRDMDRAVARLSEARAKGERLLIFGDYDVDGTSGAALLVWIFRDMGFSFEALQPDRFKDGYGLNVQAVRDAKERGIGLIVTVDCGITSFDAAKVAREIGIDLIVVDHHQIDAVKGLPDALAIVNPQRADCPSGLKQLCGCGLAFYLAIALRAHGRSQNWFEPGKEPNLKQHLDLVVLATAADMVPLIGDNRILVSHGMEILKNTKKPGLRALMDVAGIFGKTVSPGNLGFVLGPRINASGRMQSASLALELLTTTDLSKAYEMAKTLEQLNTDRAEIQNQIWDDVRNKVEKGIAAGLYPNGIVIADEGWHEGVVGIVASRVTETFRRPAAIIAIKDDPQGEITGEKRRIGKGSVRSYGGKDILAALRASKDLLLGFGGHRFAAGLTALEADLPALNVAFNEALAQITVDANLHALTIEGECRLEDLDVKTLEEFEKLAPFGPGNPEPVYALQAKVDTHRILKGRHLKLRLSSQPSTDGPVGKVTTARIKNLDAIWFHAAEREDIMIVLGDQAQLAQSVRWAGIPELNRFDGRITPSFRLKDWKPASEHA